MTRTIWNNRIGVSSSTRRTAILGGGMLHPTVTNLGELRKFVASLERWPDAVDIRPTAGAVLSAEYIVSADSLVNLDE